MKILDGITSKAIRTVAIVQKIYAISGKKSVFFTFIGFMLGVTSFIFDLLLAISLQRFFSSTGLIEGITETRIFGKLNESKIEAIILLLVGFIRSFVLMSYGYINGVNQALFETKSRKNIALWGLNKSKFESGSMSNLYQNLVQISASGFANFQYLIVRVCMLFIALISLGYYSIPLTAFIITLIILLLPIQKILNNYLHSSGIGTRNTLETSSEYLFQNAENSIFLRVSGSLSVELNKINYKINEYLKFTQIYNLAASIRGVMPQFIGLIFVVILASRRGYSFLDSQGELVAFLYISIRFFQILGDTAKVSATLRNGWPRLKDLLDWHDTEFFPNSNNFNTEIISERESVKKHFTKIEVIFRKVGFRYNYDNVVLSNFSFKVESGKWLTIFGGSGSGKSSILKLALGLLIPNSGKIIFKIDNENFEYLDILNSVRHEISYVSAEPIIINGTIKENLLYGRTKNLVIDFGVLVSVGGSYLLELPDGLDTIITKNGTELSTGERQRISIIRAILNNPRLLILDEATSNLDLETERNILCYIKQEMKGTTVMAASHRESYREFSDVLLNLDENESPDNNLNVK